MHSRRLWNLVHQILSANRTGRHVVRRVNDLYRPGPLLSILHRITFRGGKKSYLVYYEQ